ncbi:gliding motility-associated lipoprotein GldD [Mariniflexile fucanivorans]|uniref:Gliding motility-associated lipoprotein GldD n=1 Tax=Mariniflexile fucanivorans TaxID=264023 RepID=A0A4R1RQZ5_9FLAO|nr:gliding motility lipoprotein GldD [Mariniflexile fucanivorans]TCL68851.1 gliding motility-associated lipoprotein GldD [Mariniflexile fucanivorans]
MKHNLYLLVVIMVCFSCGQDYIPKPKAYLRLDYPKAQYRKMNLEVPFYFETNSLASDIKYKKLRAAKESYGINIEYPSLKGTIFLTYKAIDGDSITLMEYLKDAQKFTLEHTIKADEIPVFPYENNERKVYGVFSEVKGNVASPAQFYVTDSIKHFLVGSLYFYAKPNYDSILPAANYLQKDMIQIMESLHWK